MSRHNGQGEQASGVFVGAEALPEVFTVVDVRRPDLPQTVAPHARRAQKVRRGQPRCGAGHAQSPQHAHAQHRQWHLRPIAQVQSSGLYTCSITDLQLLYYASRSVVVK